MSDGEARWDVFLCYKFEDAQAAEALRLALNDVGLRVFQDVIEGEVAAPLSASVEDALRNSRILVALITPRFPASPHCREELHLALCAAYQLGDSDASRVVAVLQDMEADDVRPRRLTAFRLPRSNMPSGELAPVIAGIVARHEGVFGDAPVTPDPKWYPRELPGDRQFRGRFNELWELHEGLLARQKNRDRGHPVVAVGGQGGIGKTALCLQYARLFQRDHPGGVFLIELAGSGGRGGLDAAAVEAGFREQLALIAAELRVPGPDDVKAALEKLGQPYLWIVDDVPADIDRQLIRKLYAPTPFGKTLMTTRGRFDRLASAAYDLPPLDAGIGGQMLTAHRPAAPAERDAVSAIVRLLGGHPLGLTLAASLAAAPRFSGYAALLADLSTVEPDRLEAVAAGVEDQLPAGCAQPFANALLRDFDGLSGTAQRALTAASVLAPTVIPRDLLARMLEAAPGAGTDGPDHSLDYGLECAVERRLIDTDRAGNYIMHALVARAVRIRVEPAAARARVRNTALAELTRLVERTRDAYRHREILEYLPHVRAVAGSLPGSDAWKIGEDERHLLNESGRTQIEAGLTAGALADYAALYAACQDNAEVDAVTRYTVLTGLAAAHGLEGEFTKALELKRQAVDGLAGVLGHGHPDVLTAQNNLAVSYFDLQRYEEAHSLFREVYLGRRNHPAMGKTHRTTLVALNNLAFARGHLGASPAERYRHKRAAHLYWLGAQERWRKIAAPDDLYALDVLTGLALSYRALEMPGEALRVSAELCERRRALLGPDHPDTLSAQENTLILRVELGDRAEGPFQSVLLGRLRGQGPGHHLTDRTMRNLIRHELHAAAPAESVSADLPGGVTPDRVRLDADHVDAEIDLQQLAMALQQERVDAFGPDDPQTMIATSYLAYSLAAADHLDGQLEWAHALAQDAYEGIADAADEHADSLGPRDLEVARLIRDWTVERLGAAGG